VVRRRESVSISDGVAGAQTSRRPAATNSSLVLSCAGRRVLDTGIDGCERVLFGLESLLSVSARSVVNPVLWCVDGIGSNLKPRLKSEIETLSYNWKQN